MVPALTRMQSREVSAGLLLVARFTAITSPNRIRITHIEEGYERRAIVLGPTGPIEVTYKRFRAASSRFGVFVSRTL